MKRHEFLRHLRFHGCILKREGTKHSLYQNPVNGAVEAIPRNVEIENRLENPEDKNLVRKRIEFAREYTWDKIAEGIWNLVNRKFEEKCGGN